jgi:hypothetical protein
MYELLLNCALESLAFIGYLANPPPSHAGLTGVPGSRYFVVLARVDGISSPLYIELGTPAEVRQAVGVRLANILTF